MELQRGLGRQTFRLLACIVRTLNFGRACGETKRESSTGSFYNVLRAVDELPEKKENKESTPVTGSVGVVSPSRCCR